MFDQKLYQENYEIWLVYFRAQVKIGLDNWPEECYLAFIDAMQTVLEEDQN